MLTRAMGFVSFFFVKTRLPSLGTELSINHSFDRKPASLLIEICISMNTGAIGFEGQIHILRWFSKYLNFVQPYIARPKI